MELSQHIEKREDVRCGLVRIAGLEHSHHRLVGEQTGAAEHRLQLPKAGRLVADQVVQTDATVQVTQSAAVEEEAVVALEDAENSQSITAQIRLAMVDHGDLQVLQIVQVVQPVEMNAVLGEEVQRVAILLGPVFVIDAGRDAVVQPQATQLAKRAGQQREVRIEEIVDHVIVVERLVAVVPARVRQATLRISSAVGGQNEVGERGLINAGSPSLADWSASGATLDAQMTEDLEEHPVEAVVQFEGRARYRLCGWELERRRER